VTDSIPVPRGEYTVTIVNLTGDKKTLNSVDGNQVVQGPESGYVLPSYGEVTLTYHDANLGEYVNQETSQMDWGYGKYTITLADEIADVSCTGGGGYQCSASRDEDNFTVLLLEPAGTVLTPPDQRAQSMVVNYLCSDGSGGDCSNFTVTGQESFMSDERQASATVFNRTDESSKNSIRTSSKQTSTNTFSFGIKVGAEFKVFFGKVTAEINAAYNHGWGESSTFEEQFDQTIPPGYYGYITQSDPMFLNTGDLQAKMAGVTFVMNGTQWVSPDTNPDAHPNARSVVAPIPDGALPPVPDGTGPSDPEFSDAGEQLPANPPQPAIPRPDQPVAAPAATPARDFDPVHTFLHRVASFLDPFVAPVAARFGLPAPTTFVERLWRAAKPNAPLYTDGFLIVNLSSEQKTFNGYTQGQEYVESGPQQWFVLEPFEATQVDMTWNFFHSNDVVMDWGYGKYVVDLHTSGGVGTPSVTCAGSGGFECRWGGKDPETGADIIYLMDPPDTVITVPAWDPDSQSRVLDGLCDDGGGLASNCSIEPTRQEQIYTDYRRASGYYRNDGPTPAGYGILTSQSEFSSDGFNVGSKQGVKELFGFFVVEISETYGRTWQTENTFTTLVTEYVSPGYTGWIDASAPMYRNYGTITAVGGNTTWILLDTFVDSPNPDGAVGYIMEQAPNQD
jgi:hypothetical protein